MTATEELFRADGYVKTCEATVTGINDRGGIVLDRTVFYPTGGGHPGDAGLLKLHSGTEVAIATTVYDTDRRTIVHVPQDGMLLPGAGDRVVCEIDWRRRYGHMRVHTALHLLCALLPYPVTGGSIGD